MKRQMVMIVLTMVISSASGGTLNWDPDGSGGWGDATRYVEKKKPVAGDVVQINGGTTAILTDDDWDAIKDLYRIYMPDTTSRVIVDVSGTYEWTGQVYGRGSFTKLGSGFFAFTGGSAFSGCYAVTNGVLDVDKLSDTPGSKSWPLISVAEDAIFTIRGTSRGGEAFIAGLCGDGIVSNLCAGIAVMGPNSPTDNPPEYVFNGELRGMGRLGFGYGGGCNGDYSRYGGPCRQRITSVQPHLRVRHGLKIGYGDIFVPSIGDGNETNPGALGYGFWSGSELGSTLCFPGFTNMTATLHYTGDIEFVKWREFAFQNEFPQSYATIDVGNASGLEFANKWRYDPIKFGLGAGIMGRVVLSGSNTQACIVSGEFLEKKDDAGFCFIKRGIGTWRFTGAKTRENRGPIMIEQGTIEFDTIAEAGTSSSLGTASMLSTNFHGSAADCSVAWALRIGNGTDAWTDAGLATLRYTGSSDASCSTRPIAIAGAARIADNGGSIGWTGVFSDREGVNTLVLGGSGEDSLVNVTNGTGSIRIVKEGAGSWKLDGDLDFTGGIDVRSGVLGIGNEIPQARRVDSLGSVSVAAGAKLVSDAEQGVDALSCDMTLGCGTLQGVAFAEKGTLSVVGGDRSAQRIALGYKFTDCAGLENLAGWAVVIDGKICRYLVSASENGVVLTRPGLKVTVR